MDSGLNFDDISAIENKKEQYSNNDSLNNISWLLEGKNNLKHNAQNFSYDLEEVLNEEKIIFENVNKNSENGNDLIQNEIKAKDYFQSSHSIKSNFGDNINANLKNLETKKIKKFNIKSDTRHTTNDKNDFKQKNYKNIYFENEDKPFGENLVTKFNVHILSTGFNDKFFLKKNMDDSHTYMCNKEVELKFLGKKREKEQKNEKDNNINIFNDIKKLYKKYIGKEEIYKMYEEEKGFFKKIITIIEEGNPACIIYFYRNFITKIYLIIEKKFLENQLEICQVLNILKTNIQNYKELHPLNFKNELYK